MRKGLLSLILPLVSLGMCAAETDVPFGQFEDKNYAPLSRTKDMEYSVSFTSIITLSGRMEIKLMNAYLSEEEVLYSSKPFEAFTEGKTVTRTFTVPFDLVAVNDNILTFSVLAINTKYSGQTIKKQITIPYGEPIIGKNPSSKTIITGVDCYWGFKKGELVKGHGTYTVGTRQSDIYDPALNRLTPSCLSLTYTNSLYLPTFKGDAEIRILSCIDQYDIGSYIFNKLSPYRLIKGRISKMSVSNRYSLSFYLADTYAVSKQNLAMKPLSQKTENDFSSSFLFFPVGRGPLSSVYKLRISMTNLMDTGDSFYVNVNVHRTSWNFGPTFYSDYSIGIGEASNA